MGTASVSNIPSAGGGWEMWEISSRTTDVSGTATAGTAVGSSGAAATAR